MNDAPAPWPAAADGPLGRLELSFRRSYGRLLGRLVKRFGVERFELAEDALQEAMARAARHWPLDGVPDAPDAWLDRVASNWAIDRLRRQSRETRLPEAGHVRGRGAAPLWAASRARPMQERADTPVGCDDEVLAMMFLCCHPALSRASRVALTLKAVAGLGTPAIAAAFRIKEATVAQRIVRARRRLARGDLALDWPSASALVTRRAAVLDVLYLVFNEGYSRYGDMAAGVNASTAGADGAREARPEIKLTAPFEPQLLMDEAIRLADVLASQPVGRAPETDGLRALMYLQSSRLAARLAPDGALVAIDDQDRSRWDQERVGRGLTLLARSARGSTPSTYHLLAGIAACHAVSDGPDDTDWRRVLELYDLLLAAHPDNVVMQVNRLVAASRVHGAGAALEEADRLVSDPRVAGYHELPAVRGELLERLGREPEARRAFVSAAERAASGAARRALLERSTRRRDTDGTNGE